MPRFPCIRSDDNRSSLRRSLLMLGIWPCAATALILTGWFTHDRLRLLDSAYAAQGLSTAQQIAALSDLSLYAGDTAALQAIATSAVTARLADRVEISNHAGIFITAGTAPGHAAQLGLSSAPVRLTRWISLSDYPDAADAAAAASSQDASSAAAIGTVRIYRNTLAFEQERRRSLLWGLLPGLICLLLAVLSARQIARGATWPLRRIQHALGELLPGHEAAIDPLLANVTAARAPAELTALAEQVRQLATALKTERSHAQRDVRRAREQAMDSVAQVEQASRARARFLASASHDLRQPLHAMGLFIDGLQTTALPSQRTALMRLQESTQIMSRLLEDLLDISRLDAQVYTPEWNAVPLDALYAQLDAMHRPRALDLGVQLHWRARGLVVHSDAALLLRILGNLVGNAIQHSGARCVLVTARRLRHAATGGGMIRLEVRDNGGGIAPIHHGSIFEEFFQIANAERDARKGFGLGLSICARIARVLDTRIRLRSALQCGSTFSITLPAATADSAPRPASSDLVSTLVQPLDLRCLIVDDDAAIRDASSQLLTLWGCQVDTAANQSTAMALLSAQDAAYDVVLCDLQLEDATDGLTVLAHARRHQPGALQVMVSGATAPDTLRQLRQAGVALLTKPVAPAGLRALLTSLHARQKSAQPSR